MLRWFGSGDVGVESPTDEASVEVSLDRTLVLLASLYSPESEVLAADDPEVERLLVVETSAMGVGEVPSMSGASKESTLVEEIKVMGPDIIGRLVFVCPGTRWLAARPRKPIEGFSANLRLVVKARARDIVAMFAIQ